MFLKIVKIMMQEAPEYNIIQLLFMAGGISEMHHVFQAIYHKGILYKELRIQCVYNTLREMVTCIYEQAFKVRATQLQ